MTAVRVAGKRLGAARRLGEEAVAAVGTATEKVRAIVGLQAAGMAAAAAAAVDVDMAGAAVGPPGTAAGAAGEMQSEGAGVAARAVVVAVAVVDVRRLRHRQIRSFVNVYGIRLPPH
jgi:hypothetical protein